MITTLWIKEIKHHGNIFNPPNWQKLKRSVKTQYFQGYKETGLQSRLGLIFGMAWMTGEGAWVRSCQQQGASY